MSIHGDALQVDQGLILIAQPIGTTAPGAIAQGAVIVAQVAAPMIAPGPIAPADATSAHILEISRTIVEVAGAPRNPHSPNTRDDDRIARIFMRHPDPVVFSRLCELHQGLKTLFVNRDSQGLKWLHGGSS
jgi:hypothetical protein